MRPSSRRRTSLLLWTAGVSLGLAGRPPAAAAQDQIVYPIWSALPDILHGRDGHRAFAAAAARLRLGPVEVIDVAGGSAPTAAAKLAQGRRALVDLRLAEAAAILEAAVAETIATGDAGLSRDDLSDLFLYQAWALQRADWKELAAPPTEIEPPSARQAYLRAATFSPARTLGLRQFPPLVLESWRRAVAEVRARPRGSMVVKASASALVSVDGSAPRPAPVTLLDVVFGEHFVRVEDPGRRSWGQFLPVTEPAFAVDVPPQPSLALEDAQAAAHARRMGATFALVGELKPPAPPAAQQLELRLIDVTSGIRHDATSVVFSGDGAAVEAAVMRLDEKARRAAMERAGGGRRLAGTSLLVEPSSPALVEAEPAAPMPTADPMGWARRRWPLLVAIGTAVATATILGIVVSANK